MDPALSRTEATFRPPSGNDTARISAGRRALEQEHERLLYAAGATVNVARYGFNFARAVLEGDDEQGRLHGWVTRYDEIRWADVVAIATAAAGQLNPQHQGQCVRDCTPCDLTRAVGRVRESTRTAIRAGTRLDGSTTVGQDGGSASYADRGREDPAAGS